MPSALERPVTKVQKWGNSQGVRIPKEACDAAGIKVGDIVEISYEPGSVTLRVAPDRGYRRSGRRTLAEICAGYEGERVGTEWIVGSVGSEVVE